MKWRGGAADEWLGRERERGTKTERDAQTHRSAHQREWLCCVSGKTEPKSGPGPAGSPPIPPALPSPFIFSRPIFFAKFWLSFLTYLSNLQRWPSCDPYQYCLTAFSKLLIRVSFKSTYMRSLPAVCDQDIGEMRKKVPIVPKIRTETTLPLSPRNTVVRDFHLHESACDFVRVVHTVARQETILPFHF